MSIVPAKSSRSNVNGVPQFRQNWRTTVGDERYDAGSPWMNRNPDFWNVTQAMTGAADVRRHDWQWQISLLCMDVLAAYRTAPQWHPPATSWIKTSSLSHMEPKLTPPNIFHGPGRFGRD